MERLGFRPGRPGLTSAFFSASWRLMAGTVAATLLVLTLPSPATAAPTPSVTISDATVTEGTGASTTASFTIQVAPPPKPCCSLQVSWATAPGSANAPGDFAASSGTVTLSKAAPSKVVTVSIVGRLFRRVERDVRRQPQHARRWTRPDRRRPGRRHHHRQRRATHPLGERCLRRGGQHRHHDRHVHRVAVGRQWQQRHLRLGDDRGLGHRGRRLRLRERQRARSPRVPRAPRSPSR